MSVPKTSMPGNLKKISLYTKSGARAATTYYRIYQFTEKIEAQYRYKKMISDNLYKKIMPISSKSVITKILIFIYIYIRVLFQLLEDYFDKPDIIVISRRLINRCFPSSYKFILNSLRDSGVRIIWDFDDQIIESREVSKDGFAYLESLADYIVIASNENKSLISRLFRNKIRLLPTTDGDMYKLLDNGVTLNRKKLLDKEIRLIWIGTSVSLKYLEKIIEGLNLKNPNFSKKIILTVVCDKPLVVKNDNGLEIRNIKWERDICIKELLNSHIGLMPLEDNKFTRGKGGFKLIQYLSVGLPVIGSPVGINKSIISSKVGVQVEIEDTDKWGLAIKKICNTNEDWQCFSNNAIKEWRCNYNFDKNLEVWKELLS